MRLWDLMKASKGIPVSDPMARLWGRKSGGGFEEISGVPPLSFTSRGAQLLDYRIYGNAEDAQGCGEYDSELDGYKIPVMVAEQPHILFTETVDDFVSRGASWSIKNGIVSVTGTATGQSNPISVMGNRAGMSGDFLITKNNENTRISISCLIEKNGVTSYDSLEPILRLDGTETRVAFFPQVQAGTYNKTCTPTIQQVITTPVYIGNEPLYDGEYVSFSEQKIYRMVEGVLTPVEPPVSIPEIQVFEGENILTVDTTVQPSNVYVKYKKG